MSEPKGRGTDWTEERGTSDEGRRRLESGPEASGTTLIRTRLTEILGIRHPIVQAAMGYVSGPRLAAATSNAGGLGLIASATMSLAELEDVITETAGRTSAPFGVNLRADAPDAAERVTLIIAGRVPVVSFAQAPRPDGGSRHESPGSCRSTVVKVQVHVARVVRRGAGQTRSMIVRLAWPPSSPAWCRGAGPRPG
jgi:Nitronate monooxygenase